jgi:prepilin-type N-terminal cleavage/methylation domain-containing protein
MFKITQQEQGFTLVEVLVAILIITVFIATAMQAITIAAVFRVRAKQYSEATNWIQEDLENVRQQAFVLGSTTLSAVPTANSLSVPSGTTGFAAGNRLQIGTISGTLFTISNTYTAGSTTIAVTPALTAAQITATPAGTPVSVIATGSTDTTLCYATAQNDGFGNFLSNNLPTLNSTKTIAGATYTLSRTATVRVTRSYEVLQLTHSVAQGTKPPVATFNTEVIPNATFQCPAN